jgi:hypothetical protein
MRKRSSEKCKLINVNYYLYKGKFNVILAQHTITHFRNLKVMTLLRLDVLAPEFCELINFYRLRFQKNK